MQKYAGTIAPFTPLDFKVGIHTELEGLVLRRHWSRRDVAMIAIDKPQLGRTL
jgi:hypothetical protein